MTVLNYTGILGNEDKAEYHLKEPALIITPKKQAEDIQYQFGKQEAKDDYVMKVSNQPYYFKVNKAQVDALKDLTLQKLVTEKPDEPGKEDKTNVESGKTKEKK